MNPNPLLVTIPSSHWRTLVLPRVSPSLPDPPPHPATSLPLFHLGFYIVVVVNPKIQKDKIRGALFLLSAYFQNAILRGDGEEAALRQHGDGGHERLLLSPRA